MAAHTLTGVSSFTSQLVKPLLGSLFIALAAQVEIVLPISPVPFTLQAQATLLVGALLGARQGFLSVLLYILEGISQAPVFAGGGAGVLHMIGPSGGYIWGFALGAAFTGWLAEYGWDKSFFTTALSMLFGNAIIFAAGVAWLSYLFGFSKALQFGLYPFVITDFLKVLFVANFFPIASRVMNERHFTL